MHKRLFQLTLLLFLGFTASAQAQRFGFINTEEILKKMPEYAKAEQELNTLTNQWKSQMQQMQRELIGLRQKLEAEKVVYTAEMLSARQEEIKVKETTLSRFQEDKFGIDGELFKKRRELIGPLQGQVYEAARRVCKKKNLNALFDKASDLHVIYSDDNLDFTTEVLEELGIK